MITTDDLLKEFNAYTRVGSDNLYDKQSVKIAMKMYALRAIEELENYTSGFDVSWAIDIEADRVKNQLK